MLEWFIYKAGSAMQRAAMLDTLDMLEYKTSLKIRGVDAVG